MGSIPTVASALAILALLACGQGATGVIPDDAGSRSDRPNPYDGPSPSDAVIGDGGADAREAGKHDAGHEAGKDDASGPCGDTMTNPANCGGCGHACDTGEGCEAGLCDPLLVGGSTTNDVSVGGITLDTVNLYFTEYVTSTDDAGIVSNAQYLASVPLGGGATTTLVTGGADSLGTAITTDGVNVYGVGTLVADSGIASTMIWQASATAPGPMTVLTSGFNGGGYSSRITTLGGNVFFVCNSNLTYSCFGIASVPVGGGAFVAWNNSQNWMNVMSAGDTLLFDSGDSASAPGVYSPVYEEPSTDAPLADAQTAATTGSSFVASSLLFTVDGGDVFQVVNDTISTCVIASTPLSGGPPSLVSPAYSLYGDGLCPIYAIAADAVNVYYSTDLDPSGPSQGIVLSVPRTSGPPFQLAALGDGNGEANVLLVDSKHLFFANGYTIYSVPK